MLVDFHEVSEVRPIYEISCTSNWSGIQREDDVHHSSIMMNQQQSKPSKDNKNLFSELFLTEGF
jgi:hypothetical protein